MPRLAGVKVCVCGQRAVAPGKDVCLRCERGRPIERNVVTRLVEPELTLEIPAPNAFVRMAMAQEARASVALDGETQSLDRPRMPPDPAAYMGAPLLTITAFGEPAAQGSKKYAGHRNGKPVLIEQSKAVKPWRTIVQDAASAQKPADWEPIDWPVGVALAFTMKRPQSFPSGDHRRIHGLPSVGKDLDKLERAVYDALTKARVWADDSRVTDVLQKKERYVGHPGALNAPGVVIRLWRMPEGA